MKRLVIGALVATLAAAAAADDARRALPAARSPAYERECAACHLAFPPGLLPAASWQRVMDTLPRHYGTDASLDPPTANELAAWLVAHAGSGKRARDQPPDDRITRAAWFTREHREVPPATWSLPAVKSAAHCTACHLQAEQGDFSERNIRIPH